MLGYPFSKHVHKQSQHTLYECMIRCLTAHNGNVETSGVFTRVVLCEACHFTECNTQCCVEAPAGNMTHVTVIHRT